MQPPFPSLTASWHNAPYPAIDPKQSHLSVSGKTVLITGGGRGIGARIAHAYAAAGAAVVAITGRTESSLDDTKSAIEKEHPGTKVLTFAADILDEAALNAAFAATKDAGTNKAGIDICVANAGFLPNAGSIASSDPKDWWRGFEVNVLGTYLTTRAFLANIHAKSDSNPVEPVLIELTTAAVCFFPPPPQFSGYITSKVASARLVECIAVECPEVRVVSVHPGRAGGDGDGEEGRWRRGWCCRRMMVSCVGVWEMIRGCADVA